MDSLTPNTGQPRPMRRRSPTNGNLQVHIDLIDRCNLQCPTCWRGTGAQVNTSSTLPLDKFREIVAKVKAEGYPNVALINWTEPFLCRNLHEYVPIVNEFGMECWLSSNLSLPPNVYIPTIISALESGVDILFVSVSGFTQAVYEINHVGGRVDWIKENLSAIAEGVQADRIKTGVWIKYLEFPYNAHEAALWQEFGEQIGIPTDVVPAYGDPKNPLPGYDGYQFLLADQLAGKQAFDPNQEIPPNRLDVSTKICSLIADRIAIDAKGDAYLCCAFPNSDETRIGPYSDISEHDLLLRRISNSFCDRCEFPRRDSTEEDRKRVAVAIEESRKHRLAQSVATASM